MITVVAGTDRKGSMTLLVARHYYTILEEKGVEARLLSLENRKVWEKGEEMSEIEKEYLIPADKFIFIMPEYNASFPGILKTMMDNSDIRKCWWHKKSALTGISDGRAGNLRGVEHMTSILNYMRMQVHYDKLLLSKINDEMTKEGVIISPVTAGMILKQIDEFIKF